MTSRVCIAMATYNGAPYIREQIASLQAQTVKDWRLLVRDDGSSDGTAEVLEEMAAGDPRISILPSSAGASLGPSGNFSALMAAALAAGCTLLFLCDQDDVWAADKLQLALERFPARGEEAAPILVHSDLEVVDENLRTIHPSMTQYMGLNPLPERPLNYLLSRNFVTGCTAVCNRKLLEAALPVSEDAIMHDWWLALVAAASGEIRYIDRSLVKYRQHGQNSIGAKGFWHGLNPSNNWIKGWKAGNAEYRATRTQVAALAQSPGYRDWPPAAAAVIQDYLQLGRLPALARFRAIRKLGLRQGNRLLLFIFYLRALTVHDSERLDRGDCR